MNRLLAIICLLSLTAGPALALSCVQPTIESSYLDHAEAAEQYILVFGRLINKRNVVHGPKIQGSTGAHSENFTATFVGQQATRAGFDRPMEIMVAVSTTCAGAWCGAISTDLPMIAFLQVTPYGHRLIEGPCGGNIFYTPTRAEEKSALRCLRGGVCNPDRR